MNHNISSLIANVSCTLLCFLLTVTFVYGCQSQATNPKAIFIIVDGVPADVLESTATPNLDEISGVGGYSRAFVGGIKGEESESPTLSAVGYNSLITGTWADKHNVWSNNVTEPNYNCWDIFRIAKAFDPTLQTAIFSTWVENRTKLLGDGLEAAGGNKLDYHFDGFKLDTERFPHDLEGKVFNAIDELVTNEAARYVDIHGPDLSWVYLEYTDEVGHRYGDSRELIEAVKIMDDQIGRIWKSIRRREQNYNEDWLIVITTDHGRHAATGMNHGGQSERERTTWIVTNSVRLNSNFEGITAIVDILPSLATHLQLSMPSEIRNQLDGQSFID